MIKLTDVEQAAVVILGNRELKQEAEALRAQFTRMRFVLTAVATVDEETLHNSQAALLGLLARSHELLLGGVNQLISGNRHLFALSLRGQVESLGLICWLEKTPARIVGFLTNAEVSVGKTNNCAFEALSEAKDLYSKLSKVCHPNIASLLSGLTVMSEEDRLAALSIPPIGLKKTTISENVNALMYLTKEIMDRVEGFVNSNSSHILQAPILGLSKPGGT